MRKVCLQLSKARLNLEMEESALAELTAEQRALEATVANLYTDLENVSREYRQHIRAKDQHRSVRPDMLARLLRSKQWNTWAAANAPYIAAANTSKEQLAVSEKLHQEATSALEKFKEEIRGKEKSLALSRKQLA